MIVAALGVACTKTGASSAGAAQSGGTAPAPLAPLGNACDRHLVTTQDVAGILRDPITKMKSLATDGDAQSCQFETAAFALVTVTLRPGLGNATVGAWASGRMPMSAAPLIGVGDRAVWVAELKEVIATKNDLLCDIGVGGPPGASVAADVVEKRLGDLCNTVFAKQ
jgi:hypothetical protein